MYIIFEKKDIYYTHTSKRTFMRFKSMTCYALTQLKILVFNAPPTSNTKRLSKKYNVILNCLVSYKGKNKSNFDLLSMKQYQSRRFLNIKILDALFKHRFKMSFIITSVALSSI